MEPFRKLPLNFSKSIFFFFIFLLIKLEQVNIPKFLMDLTHISNLLYLRFGYPYTTFYLIVYLDGNINQGVDFFLMSTM